MPHMTDENRDTGVFNCLGGSVRLYYALIQFKLLLLSLEKLSSFLALKTQSGLCGVALFSSTIMFFYFQWTWITMKLLETRGTLHDNDGTISILSQM